MIADNPVAARLAAPLEPDWTVDRLAEEILLAIAVGTSDDSREFIIDAETTSDRQTRRRLRPLLACLATKSAAETGASPTLYGGQLSFQRPGREGTVWILGRFENTLGEVRVSLRRTSSPPRHVDFSSGHRAGLAGIGS